MSFWNTLVTSILNWLVGILLGLFGLGAVAGCAALNQTPPIETFAAKFTDEVIAPAVKQGLAQGVENLQVQAGAQGINPTYVIEFEGYWVTGIKGRATIGAEGIAGQIQISSVSTEETETSPLAGDRVEVARDAGLLAPRPTPVPSPSP
jgi:hypothetical protein